jgi:hypothetical protein
VDFKMSASQNGFSTFPLKENQYNSENEYSICY